MKRFFVNAVLAIDALMVAFGLPVALASLIKATSVYATCGALLSLGLSGVMVVAIYYVAKGLQKNEPWARTGAIVIAALALPESVLIGYVPAGIIGLLAGGARAAAVGAATCGCIAAVPNLLVIWYYSSWRVAGSIAAALIAIALTGCHFQLVTDARGRTYVASEVGAVFWAKDGKALYYSKRERGGKEPLYRFDIPKEQSRKVLGTVSGGSLDISTGERFLLSCETGSSASGIWVLDLASGRRRCVYRTNLPLDWAHWVSQDRILFTEGPSTGYLNNTSVRMINRDGSNMIVLVPGAAVEGLVRGEDAFIYRDYEGNYHRFDLPTLQSRSARAGGPEIDPKYSPDGTRFYEVEQRGGSDWYNAEPDPLWIDDVPGAGKR